MRFRVKTVQFTIDKPRWQQDLHTDFEEQIKKAGRVWLNSIVFSVVPVWAGSSVATFKKLAREVNFSLVITPSSTAQNHIAAGAAGVSLGFRKSDGKIIIDRSRAYYAFTYSTTLPHLVFNEFQDGNQNPKAGKVFSRLLKPGPYHFQEVGREAFEDYVKREVRLNSPWKFIRKQTNVVT